MNTARKIQHRIRRLREAWQNTLLFGPKAALRLFHDPRYVPERSAPWVKTIWGIDGFSRRRHLQRLVDDAQQVELILTFYWGGGATSYLTTSLKTKSPGTLSVVVKPTLGHALLSVEVWRNGSCALKCFVPSLSWFAHDFPGKIDSVIINELVLWHRYMGVNAMSAEAISGLVDEILGVVQAHNTGLLYLVHDYYSACPRVTTVSPDGVYCAHEYDVTACQNCLTQGVQGGAPVVAGCDITRWRQAFHRLFSKASEVRTFSEDTSRRMRWIFPGIAFTCVPHQPLAKVAKAVIRNHKHMTVGVFGSIEMVKGARQLLELVEYTKAIGANVSFVVVGELQIPPNQIPEEIKILGRYKRQDLTRLVEENDINMAAFLSICPETYSYVVQEMMALGLPVATFPVGAPADCVADYPLGRIAKDFSAEAIFRALTELFELQRLGPQDNA